jgi:hypothetical protein
VPCPTEIAATSATAAVSLFESRQWVLRIHPKRIRNAGETCGDRDAVAQRKFIRNAAATPNCMFLFKSCGVAEFFGGGGKSGTAVLCKPGRLVLSYTRVR